MPSGPGLPAFPGQVRALRGTHTRTSQTQPAPVSPASSSVFQTHKFLVHLLPLPLQGASGYWSPGPPTSPERSPTPWPPVTLAKAATTFLKLYLKWLFHYTLWRRLIIDLETNPQSEKPAVSDPLAGPSKHAMLPTKGCLPERENNRNVNLFKKR